MPRPASSRKSQPARRPVAVSVKKTAKTSVAAAKAATARRTRANGAARSATKPPAREARGGNGRRTSERVLHTGRGATESAAASRGKYVY